MQQAIDPHIRYTIEDKVFIIEIHRPEKKNALLPSMYKALAEGIRHADATDALNVILLKGVDFCRTAWPGMIKVRPTYRFLTKASR